MRVVVKYSLLQIPGQAAFVLVVLLLRQWLEIPPYLVWALIVFWVVKDTVLFFFLWRFYDPNYRADRFRMVGRKGVALTRLDPDGYVRVRAERWRASVAEGSTLIEKSDPICVVAADGLTLTVSACADHHKR